MELALLIAMETIKRQLRGLQGLREHYLNPLHVYCRLIDLGLSRASARQWALALTINLAPA